MSLKDKLTDEHTVALQSVSDDQKLLNPSEAFKLEEFVLLTQLKPHRPPAALQLAAHCPTNVQAEPSALWEVVG